jgi:Mg2+/Co2+ transporter CorB
MIGGAEGPFLAEAQLTARPALLIIWLLLGISHLRLAWALVERDWARITDFGAAIAATTVTIFIFSEVMSFDVASLIPQAAALAIELAVILLMARWQARVFPDGPAAIRA